MLNLGQARIMPISQSPDGKALTTSGVQLGVIIELPYEEQVYSTGVIVAILRDKLSNESNPVISLNDIIGVIHV